MATASDYKITTPFGQIPGYEKNGGFHRGVDRICPVGTQVIVNGVQIGLSGNTGEVYPAPTAKNPEAGRHLHVGKFVNNTAVNPGTAGFSFNHAVVLKTGQDNVNGKWVQLMADNNVWCYLHLSQITCAVGQVLNGSPAPQQTQPTATGGGQIMQNDAQVADQYFTLRGNQGTPGERAAWIGKPYAQFNNTAKPEIAARQANLVNLAQTIQNQQVTISQLNATISELNNWKNSDQASDAEKAKAYEDAQSRIAELTQQIQMANEKQSQHLQAATNVKAPEPKVPFVTKVFLLLLKLKKKK